MKELLRGHSIANRVRMARLAHAGAFLLVEGEDDKKFYKSFVDGAACRIEIAYGKPNVLSALLILDGEGFRGVLAVIDADFSVLGGRIPDGRNIVCTDTHDLETMLIRSPALDRLLNELGDEKKLTEFRSIHGKDIRHKLLGIGEPVGYLRWLSEVEHMSLFFDDLIFERLVDERSFAMDERALLRELQNRSRQGVLDEAVIRVKIDGLRRPEHDLWHVCCGHDLVRILAVALRRVLGSNKDAEVKPERIEMLLRIGYAREQFVETRLWAAIRAWEDANPPFVVLAHSVERE